MRLVVRVVAVENMEREGIIPSHEVGFLGDAARLRRLYFSLRWERFSGRARKWYRAVAKEKARLAGLGHDPELIRLYCLHLVNPRLDHRLKRFNEYLNRPVQLDLFASSGSQCMSHRNFT